MFDVSVGLDLATSASIIGASIAYVLSERKKRLAEQQWRKGFIREKQVELSHLIVQDVLDFIPLITGTARRIHSVVEGRSVSLPDGTELLTHEGVANAVFDEFSQLRVRIEFELLRPLEVKVDFVDGQEVWDREAAKCRGRLDDIERAMQALRLHCAKPSYSVEKKQEMLAQAVPLINASEPIGGEIASVYTAVISLATDLKDGLLRVEKGA